MSSIRRRTVRSSSDAETSAADTEISEAKPIQPAPGLLLPTRLCCLFRVLAAATSVIADCDETFNYWEPLHFITFGHGFQTWEYSPTYALRSYLFLLPHAGAAYSFALLQGRPAAFFLTRCLQGIVSVAVEHAFCAAISERFGADVGRNTAILLALSPGMFVAAVAFLPSSIAILQVCGVWALWLRGHLGAAIFLGACAVIVVWPFTCILFVPLGLHALWALGPGRALAIAVASFSFWSMLAFAVDSFFYGQPILPTLEIIRYNIFERKKHGGSELYGVEPWYYYFVNGALNLNVVLPAALLLPVCCLFSYSKCDVLERGSPFAALGFCLAAFAWLAFYSTIPHKEERFLAPVYPIFVFAAAVTVKGIVSQLSRMCQRLLSVGIASRLVIAIRQLSILFLLVATALSLSRIAALQIGYGAPLPIYRALNVELAEFRQTKGVGSTHVCVGSEWYRFMTSFFLPDHRDHLSYIRFGPTGQLPAEFNATLGTAGIPTYFNDMNQEDQSRYIEPSLCDFLIDLDIGEGKGDLVGLRKQKWETVAEQKFLDASQSRQPWRAFHVPGISTRKNVYATYRLLRRPRGS